MGGGAEAPHGHAPPPAPTQAAAEAEAIRARALARKVAKKAAKRSGRSAYDFSKGADLLLAMASQIDTSCEAMRPLPNPWVKSAWSAEAGDGSGRLGGATPIATPASFSALRRRWAAEAQCARVAERAADAQKASNLTSHGTVTF